MVAYEPESWHDFFLAISGVGATLAGLVFVAVSINLREIVKLPGLGPRAAGALVLLLDMVVIGLVGLAPGAGAGLIGALIAAAAVFGWVSVTGAQRRTWHLPGPTRRQRIATFTFIQAATIPQIIAGASLAIGAGGGLYWLIPGMIFALAASMVEAWVLLVEILR